jgi:hypothetical protein
LFYLYPWFVWQQHKGYHYVGYFSM